MNAGKSKMARKAGGWMKAAAGLAVLAGTALWSGCDKSMDAMARRSLAAALVSDDAASSGALERHVIYDVKAVSSMDASRCLASGRLEASPKAFEE